MYEYDNPSKRLFKSYGTDMLKAKVAAHLTDKAAAIITIHTGHVITNFSFHCVAIDRFLKVQYRAQKHLQKNQKTPSSIQHFFFVHR